MDPLEDGDVLETLLLESRVGPPPDLRYTQRVAQRRPTPLTWLTNVRSPLFSSRFLHRHHTAKPLKLPRMAAEGAAAPSSLRDTDRRLPGQQGGG